MLTTDELQDTHRAWEDKGGDEISTWTYARLDRVRLTMMREASE